MRMSVREARAQFAHALSAAERGERVTITKNGKPIAEIGPPTPPVEAPVEAFWDKIQRVRREMGLADKYADVRTDEQWLDDFNDPAWTRELFGPQYYDYFDNLPATEIDEPGSR